MPRSGTNTRPARSVGAGVRLRVLPFTWTVTGPAPNAGPASIVVMRAVAANAASCRGVLENIEYEDLRACMVPKLPLPVLRDFSDRFSRFRRKWSRVRRYTTERSVAHRPGRNALGSEFVFVILVLVAQRSAIGTVFQPTDD